MACLNPNICRDKQCAFCNARPHKDLKGSRAANQSALDKLKAEIAAKDKLIEAYRSIMIAALEELEDHIEAHRDEDGFIPETLMNYLSWRRAPSETPYPEILYRFREPSDNA